jgi:hypothetical protein
MDARYGVSWQQKRKKIFLVHFKFCKHLLGVKPQTQNNFMYGELCREQLIQLRRYES